MPIQCFWLEPTTQERRWLRRYASGSHCSHSSNHGYHNAEVRIEDGYESPGEKWYHGDPRWPTHCACGYAFSENDTWQLFQALIYRRADTGEETTLREAPPGGMWDAKWLKDWPSPDGLHLIVKCPPDGHEWHIDGTASNCTRKDEPHFCWIRHGTPPKLTVDKNGDTCGAGVGSILTPKWHGYLRDGFLVDA